MATLQDALGVVHACDLMGEIQGDRLNIYLRKPDSDFLVDVVSVYFDPKDRKWTTLNKRPDMTDTPRDECYFGCSSLDEAISI